MKTELRAQDYALTGETVYSKVYANRGGRRRN
jgi:hypothetical protein